LRQDYTIRLEEIKLDEGDIKNGVYDLLKKMIMKRDFTPNERLDAYEIAKKLGVSRTPVRDALNMLDSEGFVKTLPRKGTFVVGMYKEDFIHLFQYREMVELFSLNVGFEYLQKNIAVLENLIHYWEMIQKDQEYDRGEIMENDSKIHKFIVASSQNPKIINSYDNLQCHVKVARSYYQPHKRLNETHQEHKQILQSIEKGDREAAKIHLKNHLENSKENLLSQLELTKVF